MGAEEPWMRGLVLAMALVLGLSGGAAEAGPWGHFHLNLGKRLGSSLHRLGGHHSHSPHHR
jgi:hypothetical protein